MPTKRKLIGGALDRRTAKVQPGGFIHNKNYAKTRRFHIKHDEIIQRATALLWGKVRTVRCDP